METETEEHGRTATEFSNPVPNGNCDELTNSKGNRNVFVGDLNKDITEDEVLTLFRGVGEVDEVIIKRAKATKKPLGYGFVRMKTVEDAHKCMKKLHNACLGGRPIRLGWGEMDCCFKLDNLNAEVTTDELNALFSSFGSLEADLTTIERQDNNATAVLHFDSRENAETAKTMMHGKQFQNRLLRIEWVKPTKKAPIKASSDDVEISSELDTALDRERHHNSAVTVAPRLGENPISFHSIHVQFEAVPGILVNHTHLQEIFSTFGEVTDVYIKNSIVDQTTGANRGYAFVHFAATETGKKAAIRAAREVTNVTINGILLFVELSKVFRKNITDGRPIRSHSQHPSPPQPPQGVEFVPSPRIAYSPGYHSHGHYGSPPLSYPMDDYSTPHYARGAYAVTGTSPGPSYGYPQDQYMQHHYGHVSPTGHVIPYPIDSRPMRSPCPSPVMQHSSFGYSPPGVYVPQSPVYAYSPHHGVGQPVYGYSQQPPSSSSYRDNSYKRKPAQANQIRNTLRDADKKLNAKKSDSA